MKKNSIVLAFIIMCFMPNLYANPEIDSTGMLGDNFSLEGALEMFKKSESPEDFEKRINDANSSVNNLDLNEDGYIDYIKVIDKNEGDSHAIILQTDINRSESQDIAVIEMEKTGNNKVVIQIIGDEELYGSDVIVEPLNNTTVVVVREEAPTYVNVWSWPTVRFIYGPRYQVWVSPWRWRVYPRYWKPWRPHPWRVFHRRRAVYYTHYHPVHVLRVHRAHAIYKPHRRTSIVVKKRSVTIRNNRRGNVVKTKTKKTKVGVKTKNGKVFGAKKTTKTTSVKNRNVVGKKKTTKTTRISKGRRGAKVTKTRRTTTKTRRRRK